MAASHMSLSGLAVASWYELGGLERSQDQLCKKGRGVDRKHSFSRCVCKVVRSGEGGGVMVCMVFREMERLTELMSLWFR